MGLGAGLAASCSLLGVKREVTQIAAHGVITLRVVSAVTSAPIYALVWTTSEGGGTNDITGFQPAPADGLAVFLLLQKRTYDVGAFADLNENGAYDVGEPLAFARQLRPAPMADTGIRGQTWQLNLSATNRLPASQATVRLRESPEPEGVLPVALGEIANLDDARFSVEAGELGMWKPFEFVSQHGFGIYFLEPYDPHRLPVLFVYGIAGSPQDWRVAMEKLDRRKYQAWFAYYPSGSRLDKVANGLAGAILLLKQRHGFDRLAVVAHSMGGLVSRGAIQRVVKQAGTNFVPEFFTVSTPWGGHEAAASAVKHLKYPVPSWRDMAPGSDYLEEILSQPLPAGTRHDLMFSFKHSGSIGLPPDNDGVVGVASELYEPVQTQAASVFGLPLGHMEIPNSPITLRRIEARLAP